MIITKEHQEAMVSEYLKSHNAFEVCGYVDGINDIFSLIIKMSGEKMCLPDEVDNIHSFREYEEVIK